MSLHTSTFQWPAYDSVTSDSKFYMTPAGQRSRVTKVLKVVGTGYEYITNWAVGTERTAVLNAAVESMLEGEFNGPQEFQMDIEARLTGARQHVKELAKAGEIGTSIHQMIQWQLRQELGEEAGPAPVLSDAAQWGFMAWQDWYKNARIRPVRIEQPVWEEDRVLADGTVIPGDVAGTIDLVSESLDDGSLGVEDWKSSKHIYDTHHLQVGRYVDMAERMLGVIIPRARIVKIPKTIGDDAIVVRALGDMTYDYTKSGRRYVGGRKLTRTQLTAAFDAALTLHKTLVGQ